MSALGLQAVVGVGLRCCLPRLGGLQGVVQQGSAAAAGTPACLGSHPDRSLPAVTAHAPHPADTL